MTAVECRELTSFVAQAPIHRKAILSAVTNVARSLPAGSRVLDAGAGPAPYRCLFAHCQYTTQDWANTPHGGAASADIVADLHDLPCEVGTFDFVLCTEVIEHVAAPGLVLAELARVTRTDGRLLMTVPFVGPLHEEPYDYWRPTNHALRDLLEAAGFTAIRVEPLTGWWGMLAHTIWFYGLATLPADRRGAIGSRAVAFGLNRAARVLGALTPYLDRMDTRRALPLGWCCHAVRS